MYRPEALAIGGAIAVSNYFTESFLRNGSSSLKKTAFVAGIVIMGSPLAISMGVYTTAYVVGTGLGMITGSTMSPEENESARERMIQSVKSPAPQTPGPYSGPYLRQPVTNSSGNVTRHELRNY